MLPNKANQTIEIQVENYISEKKEFILEFIKHNHRILINSSPGSGKTTFFAELCKDHLQKDKPGRIIFCSPFLIIQNQFEQSLNKRSVKIDFHLNHRSKRKQLVKKDKIVTSTFHSLHLIENQITDRDLIVIDEAHALLYNYKEKQERKFFISTIQVLYHTNAKVVAMSGTPYEGVSKILNLKELKVIKETQPARINIQYSKDNESVIVSQFAEECLERFGKDHLNIIYIKSRKKCERFKLVIEQQFNCKAFVLTAARKDNYVYDNLTIDSYIPDDITFLITTNVISTGANILNEKIGKALILNESNPVEIKQFSKRFRKKFNIEIDLVNREYSKFEASPSIERNQYKNERGAQRYFFQNVAASITNSFSHVSNKLNYNHKFYSQDNDGSPLDLIDRLIKKTVIQEAYFVESINATYNTPNELNDALKKYDDVMPILVNNYSFEYSEKLYEDDLFERLSKSEFEELIDSFIASYESTLYDLYKYLANNGYSYLCLKISQMLPNFNIEKVPSKPQAGNLKIFRETNFIEEIFKPLIEINSNFQDIRKSLYFIKTKNKNKQQSVITALFINKKFHEEFIIKNSANSFHPILIRKEKDYQNLENDKERTLLLILIEIAFNYGFKHEYISLKDFGSHLKNMCENKKLKFFKTSKNSYLSNLSTDENGIIVDFDDSFKIGLLHGIFHFKSGTQERKSGEKAKSAYIFEKTLPNLKPSTCAEESSDIELIKNSTRILYFNGSSFTFEKNKWKNQRHRIITSRELITYSQVDKDYYKLLE
ncbi:MAG TPA: DEAD/DEAH box helicase family protein [Salegentibacter sp.]|uniref:DEAD/DEAH box helicase family protein n=1 Tax=Salegentibacter sp. TaxID=1903072 RepID=UPI002F95A279